MKIEIGKYAGFCDGVKNAVEKSFLCSIETNETIYVDGELIHNPQTIEMLKKNGVISLEENLPPDELKDKKVIIRAHGVSPKRLDELKGVCKSVTNLTCKYVSYVQSIVKKYSRLGYRAIVVGKSTHPEVVGIMGFVAEGSDGYVVMNDSDVQALPKDNKNIIVVSQTTMQNEMFEDLANQLKEYYSESSDVIIKNTICSATSLRQEEVKELAERNDLVLVIGGSKSSNTKRLYEIASAIKEARYIEQESDVDKIDFTGYEKIAITAGASTPDWLIESIVNKLYEREKSGIKKGIGFLLKFFTYSNLFFAMGAFFISLMISNVLGVANIHKIGIMTSLYYFILSSISHYTNDTLAINNNPQYKFFIKIKPIMNVIILLSIVAMLLLAFNLGQNILILTLFSFVMGISYNMSLKNNSLSKSSFIFSFLKKLSYIKALIISSAVVILLNGSYMLYYSLNIYEQHGNLLFSTFIVFFFMLMRQAFFDIKNSQSDKIVGSKSMTTFIEIGKLYKIFIILPVVCCLAIVLLVYFGMYEVGKLKYIVAFLYAFIVVIFIEKNNIIRKEYSFSFLIDSPLYVVGLLALI